MNNQYPSKSQACIPLLTMAEKMLERAMTLGLDAEGKEAISLRVLKCQELKVDLHYCCARFCFVFCALKSWLDCRTKPWLKMSKS